MRSFRSDNNAGLCAEALAAIVGANDGSHTAGYGDDPWTVRAEDAFRALFGDDAAVFFVATGTGANTLAIAALAEPFEHVLCHPHSHWANHESTAPEWFTRCRTQLVRTDAARLEVADLRRAWPGARGDVHEAQPGVLTISNLNELGVAYGPAALRGLCDEAHALGYRVHVDGARFANAVAMLGCEPRALASDAGVDALSFGGTKNGLALGEAVLFFPQGDGSAHERASARAPFLRKATAQLLSKHRFVSAPFAATLESGAWLRHAAHANECARALAEEVRGAGLEPLHPVDGNHVIVALPAAVHEALAAAGHGYYGIGPPEAGLARFVCSFDTAPDEVKVFGADLRDAVTRSV